MATVALILGCVLAWFLAALLAPAIVRPVRKLSHLAKKVSTEEDFSLRVEVSGNDEIATLTQSLNEMLEQLEIRDHRLEAHRDHLQSEVDLRTQSLAQANEKLTSLVDDLKQARDSAEAASEAKSEFLARMSHEIRTPMNGVLGMTELMLSSSNLEPQEYRYAQSIRLSADSLVSIINDILDFSKIEAGKLDLDCAPFDLRNTVEEAAELLAEQSAKNDLELACDIPVDLNSIRLGDALRVRQVLINLISNAVKFTKHGEVVIRLEERNIDNQPGVYFTVRDTGIGIAKENQSAVFESFSQEDGSVTRRYGGTGLGLAICKQLVTLMDGEIGVDSTPEKGSTFWFHLPLDLAEGESSSLGLQKLPAARALIVDDNQTNREILADRLAAWGIDVRCASSGQDAEAEVTRNAADPFDVILLDMHMPDMDGIKTAQAIRAQKGGNSPFLVSLNSISDSISQQQRDETRIASSLIKPVRSQELFDCLGALLQGKHSRLPSPQHDGDQVPESEISAHILLVEDNIVNREVAEGMLHTLGCMVTVAENGKQAVEQRISQGGTFDLILMDCQMPEMDGYTATQKIREYEQQLNTPAAKIIALTANALSSEKQRCLDAGMDDYLAKPFKFSQLKGILESHLRPIVESQEDAVDRLPLLDMNTVDALGSLASRNGGSLFDRVSEIYLKTSTELVRHIQSASQNNAMKDLKAGCHALRSSSGNVGAVRLSACCQALENLSFDAKAEDVTAATKRLVEVHNQSLAALATQAKESQRLSA